MLPDRRIDKYLRIHYTKEYVIMVKRNRKVVLP